MLKIRITLRHSLFVFMVIKESLNNQWELRLDDEEIAGHC